MFQYAAARRLAWKHRTPLKLDVSHLTGVGWRREYALDAFRINGSLARPYQVNLLIGSTLASRVIRKAGRIMGLLPRRTDLHEESFYFNPAILTATNNVYLHGFFQSEKYFDDAAQIIREDFMLQTPLSPQLSELAQRMSATESVSVHVRRGDYLKLTENDWSYACGRDYYLHAFEFIRARVANPHFFLFSDDPSWFRDNLTFFRPSTLVSGELQTTQHQDMHFMSCCRHHVIANSTFSWWGAWLDPRPDKLVTVPDPWFRAMWSVDTSDLIPKSWIRIPAGERPAPLPVP